MCHQESRIYIYYQTIASTLVTQSLLAHLPGASTLTTVIAATSTPIDTTLVATTLIDFAMYLKHQKKQHFEKKTVLNSQEMANIFQNIARVLPSVSKKHTIVSLRFYYRKLKKMT